MTAPIAICPTCRGIKRPDCPGCGGKGTVPETAAELARLAKCGPDVRHPRREDARQASLWGSP